MAAHVDLTDAALRKLQPEVDRKLRDARDQVQFQRNALAARVLAALVALCLVVGGYLRLEDLTHGYYTALLRLGAAGVVLMTVMGLFLLFWKRFSDRGKPLPTLHAGPCPERLLRTGMYAICDHSQFSPLIHSPPSIWNRPLLRM